MSTNKRFLFALLNATLSVIDCFVKPWLYSLQEAMSQCDVNLISIKNRVLVSNSWRYTTLPRIPQGHSTNRRRRCYHGDVFTDPQACTFGWRHDDPFVWFINIYIYIFTLLRRYFQTEMYLLPDINSKCNLCCLFCSILIFFFFWWYNYWLKLHALALY